MNNVASKRNRSSRNHKFTNQLLACHYTQNCTMSADECPTDSVDNAAEELSKSALRDNIERKGKNAYYFAQ